MEKILFTLLLLTAHSATAQLYSRANGTMVYDSDITWLADANYAKTSNYNNQPGIQLSNPGYNAGPWDGRMTFEEANVWASDLVYAGKDDWRLPSAIKNSTGSLPAAYTTEHVNDSELAHMTDLVMTNGATNLFHNLQTTMYWSKDESAVDAGTAWMTSISENNATGFFMNHFVYEQNKIIGQTYAWAVRAGDVAPVPLPMASWLFGSALVWLFSFTRPVKTRQI